MKPGQDLKLAAMWHPNKVHFMISRPMIKRILSKKPCPVMPWGGGQQTKTSHCWESYGASYLVACCVPQCLDTIVDNVVRIYYANVLGSVTLQSQLCKSRIQARRARETMMAVKEIYLCTITKFEVQTPCMNQVILRTKSNGRCSSNS